MQTAVSLAYGLGPLIGGYVVEVVGFPNIMRSVGAMNVLYAPLLLLLKSSSVRSSAKEEGELQNAAVDCEGSTGYGATSAADMGLSTYQQFENPIH